MSQPILIAALPLLVMIGLLLLTPAPLAPASRGQAAITLLGIQMLCLLFSLLMIRMQSGSDTLNTSRIAATSLVMLTAGLTAAPLLDRARTGGLTMASLMTGIFTAPLFLHGLLPKLPPLSGVALLYALMIVSVIAGLGGSKQLPMSTERFTAKGARRAIPTHGALIACGWAVLAFALSILSWTMLPPDQPFIIMPLLISGLVASFMQLLTSRAEDGLAKAGEGLAAGIIVMLMGTVTLETAALAGFMAGAAVSRSEAIAARLRIDDPQHLIGTVLIPVILGLFAPLLSQTSDMHAIISWLAVAGGLGVVLACALWPLTKLIVGLSIR